MMMRKIYIEQKKSKKIIYDRCSIQKKSILMFEINILKLCIYYDHEDDKKKQSQSVPRFIISKFARRVKKEEEE